MYNKSSNPFNTRHARKIIEANLNTHFNGRNMKVNNIQDEGVRVISKILGYKYNHLSRLDSIIASFIHIAYMEINGEEVNLCKIVHTQLLDNILKMKASIRTIFKFGSLLPHIFFYAVKRFPSISH